MVLIDNKNIVIGADTRMCASLDGNEAYWMSDDVKKLHYIGGYAIFTSGVVMLCDGVIERFKESDKTIESLQQILREETLMFNLVHPNIGKELPAGILDITVVGTETYRNQKINVLYNMNSQDDYELMTYIGTEKTNVITVGYHANRAQVLTRVLMKTNKYYNVEDMYRMVYEHLADEKVGGNLDLIYFEANSKTVEQTTLSIKDKRELKTFEDNKQLFSHYITGERVIIGDPDGILEIRGNKMVITDRFGREVMWMGLYDQFPDKFGLKLENDRNQVIVDRDDGFTITKRYGADWRKIIWTDTDTGTLHADGLVTKNLKILSNRNEIILDAEEGLIDLRPLEGFLGQEIRLSVEDGITVTRSNRNKIWLNADKGIAIDRYDGSTWTSVFYVDLNGNVIANDMTSNNMFAKSLTIENDNGLVTLKPEEGLVVVRKDNKAKTVLNATDGIYIETESEFGRDKVFGVDMKGILYAKHMRTHSLEIFSNEHDDKILLDADNRILYLKNFHLIVGQIDAALVNTGNIFADFGLVNNLAVNRLKTVLPSQTGQVDYISIEGKSAQWITANAVDTGEQATDSEGKPIFYTNSSKTAQTYEDTGIPVTIVEYENKLVKGEFTFEGSGDSSYPVITLGAGSGNGDAEKAKIYKIGQELNVEYNTSASVGFGKKTMKLSDNEISLTSDVGGKVATFKLLNTGDLEFTHPDGSRYVFGKDFNATIAGNANITAAGNLKLTGARIDIN